MLHREGATGWTNPKVLSILAMIFLCGVAVGAAGMRQYFHLVLGPPPKPPVGFFVHGRNIGFDTLKQELSLTTEQEKTVTQVLDDFAKYYQNLEEEREDVTEAGKRRIIAVLDQNQKQRFYELFKEPPRQRRPF
jgi:hypothetical protein